MPINLKIRLWYYLFRAVRPFMRALFELEHHATTRIVMLNQERRALGRSHES
jgi:hypothetical protein